MPEDRAQIIEFADGQLWYSREEDVVTIGVTQAGLDLLGTIKDLELPEKNDEFAVQDWIGEIYGKNSDLEIMAPMALRIDELNGELLDQPQLLEDDPTGDAWLIRAIPLE